MIVAEKGFASGIMAPETKGKRPVSNAITFGTVSIATAWVIFISPTDTIKQRVEAWKIRTV